MRDFSTATIEANRIGMKTGKARARGDDQAVEQFAREFGYLLASWFHESERVQLIKAYDAGRTYGLNQ